MTGKKDPLSRLMASMMGKVVSAETVVYDGVQEACMEIREKLEEEEEVLEEAGKSAKAKLRMPKPGAVQVVKKTTQGVFTKA